MCLFTNQIFIFELLIAHPISINIDIQGVQRQKLISVSSIIMLNRHPPVKFKDVYVVHDFDRFIFGLVGNILQ